MTVSQMKILRLTKSHFNSLAEKEFQSRPFQHCYSMSLLFSGEQITE